MIKFVLKIFNLNGWSLQIRSKQGTSGASTKQCGIRFELSEFQPVSIKQTSNIRMHEPQICIVNHNHSAVITWFGTHIIVHKSKRRNFRRGTFKFKIQFLVLMKNFAKQLELVTKGILKLDDSQRKTLREWIITYIRVKVGDMSRRLAYEAKASEVVWLALDLLILLWAGGVVTGEVKVTEGNTRSRHHLLKLLLLLIPEVVLFLALALVAGVVSIIVVVLGGGIELLPLGAVDNEVGGVAALEAAPSVIPSSPWGTCARHGTFSPTGWSHHRGCSRTVHQKLRPKRTR
jgi:hypothetical protein